MALASVALRIKYSPNIRCSTPKPDVRSAFVCFLVALLSLLDVGNLRRFGNSRLPLCRGIINDRFEGVETETLTGATYRFGAAKLPYFSILSLQHV